MKILVSGSSGFIGKELVNFLKTFGNEVIRLIRHREDHPLDAIMWNPESGIDDTAALEEFDAVIHLAGENIAGGRWSEKKKERILNSRVQGTLNLTKALLELKKPPRVFICSSAIGFYGNRGDMICTEETSSGNGFLADVCRRWEEASALARSRGIRTINLRTGLVLSAQGGALAKMLIPFKLGLGGVLGSGRQYVSWIAMEDLLRIVGYILTNDVFEGPVNAVSPNPVTNAELTKTFGKILKRPTFFSMPASLLRLILGKEMADEFLLSSTRVEPMKLKHNGYAFLYPDLKLALRHYLRKEQC